MNTTDLLPDLSVEEYETLKASIADDGVLVPIVMDQHHEIVDGKARRRAVMNWASPTTRPSRTTSSPKPSGSSCVSNSTATVAT